MGVQGPGAQGRQSLDGDSVTQKGGKVLVRMTEVADNRVPPDWTPKTS